ncbi:MAG: ABC transporter ATP-binding protein [Acholeplasmatales bacterium]|jgi:sodium transport system ATP-binding protein|nr:ABC transporter ATP-binding protein [Acholeplasmatales bacterium]
MVPLNKTISDLHLTSTFETPIIEVHNVSKTFHLSRKQVAINHLKNKDKVALNDLSFTVFKGQVYGLLGANGAGKTTCLRIIATLLQPDQGTILVNGHDVTKDSTLVRQEIAFLTTDLKLDPFFTPSYLFDYYSALREVPLALRNERKKQLFTRFGISEFSEVKINQLSTGMAQKASLAIALLHDPDIIIFDEPTNGLDVLTAKLVIDYILELKAQGKTIIISSHIFSLIEKTCSKVGIIIDGKMALEGDLKQLTTKENLEEVFFKTYLALEDKNE